MKLKNPMLVITDYVHDIKEHRWGQHVVRFYDPDQHIIEVGENMQAVFKRFLAERMTPQQIAGRMDVSRTYVYESLGELTE